MPDADLERIIAELEARAKVLDELITRSVTSSSERERLLGRTDTATKGSDSDQTGDSR